MPQAEYIGTAAKYSIGPHAFIKDKPDTLVQNVDDNIAGFLKENPAFRIDGKGGARTVATEDEPADAPIIPSDGFRNRDEAIAFAAKWLPNFKLDPTRSTTELQRRIEAELNGLKVDDQGEVAPINAAAVPEQIKPSTKPAPKEKVAV